MDEPAEREEFEKLLLKSGLPVADRCGGL
jgi:hypothetical protein